MEIDRSVCEYIAGRFEILAQVASGGMGDVFRARDRLTDRLVALKRLHASDHEALVRFEREAALLEQIRHDAIVGYVAHGTTDDGRPFLAMEWLEGEDLAACLSRGRLTIDATMTLVRRVAEALAAAHRAGVIHRDVKPANVFLAGGSVACAKLLDFGIARLGGVSSATRTGAGIGTPAYMAPEQARGDRDVDARVDVFALGCLAYECLSGSPAFSGEHVIAILAKILLDEPEPLAAQVQDLPPTLGDLITRMLSKDRAARPIDASAVLEAMDYDAALPPVPARATATNERRLVTIVARVESAESLGLASTRAAATDSESDRDLATRVGARLERLADGTLLLVFADVGIANEQLRRAARAALDLRRASSDAKIAIATGRAVVTGGVPVGDVLDDVAALLAYCEPGAIAVDELSAGLIDRAFALGGTPNGLRLQSERREGRGRRVMGRDLPYVGRDRDLDLLVGTFRESADEREPRGVVLTGEPGAGKSRLLGELLARAEHLADDFGAAPLLLIARGDPVEANVPYRMLAQIVRSAAGLDEHETAAVAWQKLVARVGRHLDVQGASLLIEYIGSMVGVAAPTPSEAFRAAEREPSVFAERVHYAMKIWLDRESKQQPVALIFDDAQWSDAPSLGVLTAAFRHLPTSPLFVVVAGRPELTTGRLSKFLPAHSTELKLARLGVRACERLIRSALGDSANDELVSRIVSRADGNAFFLEELIRAAAQGERSAFPETVLAIAGARIAALSDEQRRVLRAASVLGDHFVATAVERVAVGVPDVPRMLEQLVDGEFVEPVPLGREGAYSFRHALIREAADAGHTVESRTLAHLAAAEWLETVADSSPLVVAEHFERGGDPVRAAVHFERAAKSAFRRNDASLTVRASDRAMALGISGDRAAHLRVLQTWVLYRATEYARAERHADAALAAAAPGTVAWYRAIAAAFPVKVHCGSDWQSVIERFESVPHAPEHAQHWVATASAFAIDLLHAGEMTLAGSYEERLVMLLGSAGDPSGTALLRMMRGWRAHFCDDPVTAWREGLAAAEMFDAEGKIALSVFARIVALHGIQSLEWFDERDRVLGDISSASNPSHVLLFRSRVMLFDVLRRLAEGALAERREALRALLGVSHSVLSQYFVRSVVAWTEIESGDLDGAAAVVDESTTVGRLLPPHERVRRLVRAFHALRAGRADEAAEIALGVREEIARGEGIYAYADRVPVLCAEALLASGRRETAREEVARGLARLERLENAAPDSHRARIRTVSASHRRIVALARELGLT